MPATSADCIVVGLCRVCLDCATHEDASGRGSSTTNLLEQTCSSATECQPQRRAHESLVGTQSCPANQVMWVTDFGSPMSISIDDKKRHGLAWSQSGRGAAKREQKGTIGGCRGRSSCFALWLAFHGDVCRGRGHRFWGACVP